MEIAREIPREPVIPFLNNEAIYLLSDLCFRDNDPLERCDMLFVFASEIEHKTIAGKINDVLSKGYTKSLFLTGGSPNYKNTFKNGLCESNTQLNALDMSKYPDVHIYLEKKSGNTLDNVRFALEEYDFSDLKSVMFIFKTYASRRGYLTLRKYLPNTKLLQNSHDCYFSEPEVLIRKDNWFEIESSRQIVWGEFLRIRKYGRRGDIEFEEVSEIISKIEKVTEQE
jgi:hypothetical protein